MAFSLRNKIPIVIAMLSLLFTSSCTTTKTLTEEEKEIVRILNSTTSFLVEKKYDVSDITDEGSNSCEETASKGENIVYDSKVYHQYSMRILSSGRSYQQSVADITTSLDAQGVKTSVDLASLPTPMTGQDGNIYFYLVVQGEMQLTFNLLVATGCY